MELKRSLQVNAPQVISENIDGEVVIINLDSGTYYSTTGVGAVVWDLIVQGTRVDQIVDGLRKAYPEQAEVRESVSRFVQHLQNEGLIVPHQAGPSVASEVPSLTMTMAFSEPTLSAYEDMKDMLLLDPIHDVDDTGWPTPRSDDSAPTTKTE